MGLPGHDDTRLFEKLCLEGFQSGLSWRTILAKRENFRAAFLGSTSIRSRASPSATSNVCLMTPALSSSRQDRATINNAQRAQELVTQEGSLAPIFGAMSPMRRSKRHRRVPQPLRRQSRCRRISKAGLEIRWSDHGLRLHASHGVINDHADDCVIRAAVSARATASRDRDVDDRTAAPLPPPAATAVDAT